MEKMVKMDLEAQPENLYETCIRRLLYWYLFQGPAGPTGSAGPPGPPGFPVSLTTLNFAVGSIPMLCVGTTWS